MSTIYHARVVAGVRLKELNPQIAKKTSTVVRYDNITGKPYDLQVEEIFTTIGSVEIRGGLRDVLSRFDSDFKDNENEFGEKSPNYYSTFHLPDVDDQDLGDVVIGYNASNGHADSWDMTHEFSYDNVLQAMAMIEYWLADILGNDSDINPRLFVIMDVSY